MRIQSHTPLQARRGDPKGQVLVLFALVLVVLLLVSALAIDYGGWLVAKRTYQNAADAASLAGAQQLTRPLSVAECGGSGSGITKQYCARQAAWDSVKAALKLTALDPVTQALGPDFSTAYVENGYSIWVASPPRDAGAAWLGHVSGGGTVYVRIEQQQTGAISHIGQNVVAWATAGRFPANFAVIGMCRPAAGDSCLANDSNISINGDGTYLAVQTGDLGTNAWVKTNGNGAAVGLGADSNAYMEEFGDCWDGGQQCELVGFESGALQFSDVRTAIPLGAPIADPGYVAPPIGNTTTPAQCRGVPSGGLAVAPAADLPTLAFDSLPIRLASAIRPQPPQTIVTAAVKVDGKVVYAGSGVGGLTVELMQGGVAQKTTTTAANGTYGFNGVQNGTYDVRVTDNTASQTYNQFTLASQTFAANTVVPDITVQKNALVSGTVRNANTNAVISGATVTITSLGVNYTATTNPSGQYSRYIASYGVTVSYSIAVSASGYQDGGGSVPAPTALETTYPRDFFLTPAPATLTGTITDQVTGLAIPNVIVTLTGGSSGSTTTNSAGVYNFGSVTVGSTTITLTNIDGYYGGSPSTATNPTTQSLSAGANTVNFSMWPKGCGTSNSDKGDWSCSWPSGNNCGTVVNQSGANVTCSKFDNSNAIRPGTYDNIDIDGCAWLDPRGGQTGLAAGQSAGIYHIRGSFHMSNNAYIFGDGVTLVFDQGAEIDVQNSGGFVLNYGTVYSSGVCDLSTQKLYNDGNTPCFRTVPVNDGMDYAYAAWTTVGETPWSSGTFPTYDDSVVNKGKDLGITFYAYGNGYGNSTRFRLDTAGMGYLFNGVMYGPNDDIDLGGGHNSQNAAGQIVGWTIKYHGGTKITQNWYGEPVDGPPFLIEPILGE